MLRLARIVERRRSARWVKRWRRRLVRYSPVSALGHWRHRVVQDSKRNTAGLVLARAALPLLDPGEVTALNKFVDIFNRLARRRITDLDKRSRNKPSSSQSSDGLGHKPFAVRLGDDGEGFAGAGIELVGALGLKVVLDNSVECLQPGWF